MIEQGEVSIDWTPTDKMWSDVLTKPKQGKGFRQDRSMLMNCEEDYDDERERLRTNKAVLPREEGPVDASTVSGVLPPKQQDSASVLQRRSVLSKVRTGACHSKTPPRAPCAVTWNASHNRADAYNGKARTRHVELVVARILRQRNRGDRSALRRTRGLE